MRALLLCLLLLSGCGAIEEGNHRVEACIKAGGQVIQLMDPWRTMVCAKVELIELDNEP